MEGGEVGENSRHSQGQPNSERTLSREAEWGIESAPPQRPSFSSLVRGSVRSGAKSGMSKSEREQREREERKAFGYYEDLRRKVMAALEGEA